ncbi:hypothetical protein C5167_007404 [Papaver somniferum]|nr:hypothetical protein C5167_007404 [Papaver somniferum]
MGSHLNRDKGSIVKKAVRMCQVKKAMEGIQIYRTRFHGKTLRAAFLEELLLDQFQDLSGRLVRGRVGPATCYLPYKVSKDQARVYTSFTEMGIVHRNLKPQNILMDSDGHVMLTDFGMAKEIDESSRSNLMCGTTEHMVPESCSLRGTRKMRIGGASGYSCMKF